jgi:transcriptional antiterminator NusG
MKNKTWVVANFTGYNAENMLRIADELAVAFGNDCVFCPTLLEKKFNKKIQSYVYDTVPRYGGYVFIRVSDVSAAIRLISKKYSRFYMVTSPSDSGYAEISEEDIDKMRRVNHTIQHSMFRANDIVTVNSGPFKHFNGIIAEVDEEKKTAKITIEVFGSPVIVDLSFDAFDLA